MDMDVDGLCDLLSAQDLWCADENYKVLCSALETTRILLQEYTPEAARTHVTSTRRRYAQYLNIIEDWGCYGYLVDNIKRFCSLELDKDGLLLITYFVDSEILRFLESQ